MVGFAVQALQAAADPARQQAIHMQALAEQQRVSGCGDKRGLLWLDGGGAARQRRRDAVDRERRLWAEAGGAGVSYCRVGLWVGCTRGMW